MIEIRDKGNGATLAVKVHARGKSNAITGEIGGALKLALTAPPLEGKANQACIEFLAAVLKIPRSSVTIASGHSSRSKVLHLAGVSADEVRSRLAAQMSAPVQGTR